MERQVDGGQGQVIAGSVELDREAGKRRDKRRTPPSHMGPAPLTAATPERSNGLRHSPPGAIRRAETVAYTHRLIDPTGE